MARYGSNTKLKERLGLVTVRANVGKTLVQILDGEAPAGMTADLLYHLRRRKLVDKSNETISLTNLGRWQAIAYKMNLSTMELFILSEMYVDYTLRKEHNRKPFPYALRQLEDMLMMIMNMRTIYNMFWKLKRYGAVEKKATKFKLYIITDRWAKRLDRYRDDMFAMCESVHKELFGTAA